MALDALESLLERQRPAQAHALDGMARQRRDAGRILEHARQEAVAAGREVDRHRVLRRRVPDAVQRECEARVAHR